MQPVAAVLLVKLPNGKVIASAVFLWGSALCIMSACTNFASLLGLRFVLVSRPTRARLLLGILSQPAPPVLIRG